MEVLPSVQSIQAQRLNKSFKPIGMVSLYKIYGFGLYSVLGRTDKTITVQFYKEVDPSLVNDGA